MREQSPEPKDKTLNTACFKTWQYPSDYALICHGTALCWIWGLSSAEERVKIKESYFEKVILLVFALGDFIGWFVYFGDSERKWENKNRFTNVILLSSILGEGLTSGFYLIAVTH